MLSIITSQIPLFYFAAPSAVLDVRVADASSDSFLVAWNPPAATNGKIIDYEVVVTPVVDGHPAPSRGEYLNRTTSLSIKVEPLQASARYVIKVT